MQLIEFPEEMILTKRVANQWTIFRMRCRQSDLGKVIGKNGQTFLAIRNLLRLSAGERGWVRWEMSEDEGDGREGGGWGATDRNKK